MDEVKRSIIFEELKLQIVARPKTWLVTGCAGFIGSNLVESLLRLNQKVVGIDNLSTGKLSNLENIEKLIPDQYKQFRFLKGDVTNQSDLISVCHGVDIILHQAALGSVPRSIENPLNTHHHNVNGQLTVLEVARKQGIKRIVYASSSSVYGDHPDLPKVEEHIGKQLSPYAVSKYANELYAGVFSQHYGLETIGLRYFNVFGKRQDANGTYAAVIPLWIKSVVNGCPTYIYGDGETSRDFCFIENVVQANILAGATVSIPSISPIYNVACGERITLKQLHSLICSEIKNLNKSAVPPAIIFKEQRAGDVRHSLASISKIARELGYVPTHDVKQGLSSAIKWYVENLNI